MSPTAKEISLAKGGSKPTGLKIDFETRLWGQGVRRLGGLDEVGRGPWAGPVVAACVMMSAESLTQPLPSFFYQIDDSKKLGPSKREELSRFLYQSPGIEIGLGVVDVFTIDKINILEATRLAMHRAIEGLSSAPDHVLIDGNSRLPKTSIPQTPIVGGDGLSLLIGAASIVAKVFRDDLMCAYDKDYPQYGFASHKGYGTPEHQENLKKFGPCPLHRRSFAPVQMAAALPRTAP